MSRRFQTKDEVQIGTAKVGFVHVSKQSKCFFYKTFQMKPVLFKDMIIDTLHYFSFNPIP